MRTFSLESLESRTLLAGVTIMANTWDSTLGTFALGAANNLVNRVGGGANCPWYRMNIVQDPNDKNNSLIIQSVSHLTGGQASSSPVDQVVFFIDYSGDPSGKTNPVSTSPAYPLDWVAKLVTDYLQTTPVDGLNLTSVPIHLMGVSRSAILMDDIARNFGEAGIWVDNETYMDPHPVAEISDPQPVVYDSVAFADDYWRTSGQPEKAPYYNGTPVTGAYNQELPYVQAQNAGYNTPHVAPAGYYNSTIDLNSTQEFGPGYGSPVYDSWFGNTDAQPPRDKTGFYYSSYVGGPRPLSGVWAASGGTGSRVATTQSGQQWPNVTDLTVSGGNTIFSGQAITVNFLHQDRGASNTVTFALDTDANPVNNNDAATLGTSSFNASSIPNNDQMTLPTSGLAPGTYYLRAKISDGQGHDRYAYTQAITVKQPTIQVATPAAAADSSTINSSTTLSILGGGPIAESNMIYTWTVTSAPGGAAAPVFSVNGSNAAKNLMVNFSHAGTYQFQCTITDGADNTIPTATSSTTVTVQSVAKQLIVTPRKGSVKTHKTLRFVTKAIDQFGNSMHVDSSLNYTLLKGPGAIGPASGTYRASRKAGAVTVGVRLDNLYQKVGLLVVV